MTMSKSTDRKAAWDLWVSALTERSRAHVVHAEPPPLPDPAPPPLDDEESDAYVAFRSGLTAEGREAVDAGVPDARPPEADIEPGAVRYALIEVPSGEWPVVRVFKSAEGLAGRVGMLEGEDVVVAPFYGVPLSFTKGPQRYLLLPDGQTAIQVPMYQGGPCKLVDASLLGNAEVQTDGFLGPPELSESSTVGDMLEKAAHGGVQHPNDDDDDEEEENEAGV
jgi:hypothetical protein